MQLQFKRQGANVALVEPTDASYVSRAVMGDCTAYIEVIASGALGLLPGDYTTIQGHTYFIKFPMIPIRDGRRLKYQATLYGTVHELEKAKFFINDSTGVDNTSKTSWSCTPLEFVTQLVANMQRLQPGELWEVGSCLDAEPKTLELNNNSCLEALIAAAELFDTHYDVTQATVSLNEIDSAGVIELGVGQGLGLREITANKSNENEIITKLYAYGSSVNNPYGQRIAIAPLVWPGASSMIEGIAEFDTIYPRVEGEILTVNGGYPDVLQTKPLGFMVDDFLIAGRTPQMTFLSGELTGLEFRFTNPGTDQFNLTSYEISPGVVVPGATGYNYAAGDRFLIWNISIPTAYYDAAIDELTAAAWEYLSNAQAKVKLNLTTDELFFRRNNTVVSCGMKIKVTSDIIPEFASPGVECEVLSYRQNIAQPWKYDSLTVGDVLLIRPFDYRVEKVVERTILKQTEVITGVSDKDYIHSQVEPRAEWLVRHDLGKYPAVTITANDLSERDGKVTYLSPNTLKINFSVAVTGYAICN